MASAGTAHNFDFIRARAFRINLAPALKLKTCRKCLVSKEDCLVNFRKHGGMKTGLARVCKECDAKAFKISREKLKLSRPCKIVGCDGGAVTIKHGLCDAHMRRLTKNGNTHDGLPIRRFKVKKGTGYIDRNGYKRIRSRRSTGHVYSIAEHRVVMERFLGRELLQHENIHHKNGDRSDNRIENLELWSKVQPQGKRASDLVKYAYEILKMYEKDYIAGVLGDG